MSINIKHGDDVVVTIKNLSFSYNSSEPLLNDIDIFIPDGSYVSIIGENGSCKSTLVKLILGLLKPQKGEIIKKSSNIGYVPQWLDGFNSDFPITVKEVLLIHLKTLKLKDTHLIDKVLDTVNMKAFKNNLIGNLSGGQKQKILIARALLGSPELLILDEPSTGIDMSSQKDIYSIIKDLNLKSNMTVIAVEHNMDAVLANSTFVYKLKDGKAFCYDIKRFKEMYENKEEFF